MTESKIRLAVQNQFLECFLNEQLTWRTPLASILLIAEYTTNEGPYVDDYFVEFWSLEDGALLKASTSFYAAGTDDAFASIAAKLKTDFTFGLTGSTEWASRVMWPLELAGHPYFEFRNIESGQIGAKNFQPVPWAGSRILLSRQRFSTFLEKQRLDNLKNSKESNQ